ncbi:MAG: tetratricopeptide repeat protein [candidate division KSB1 bacterium]|nr:tetratricopeptide repeat protein [candidate division KSB1 bacterium]MDZ7295575.1 tetratricopeptide repeat protein [candidate division KSB1 bacterium]MDZ7377863.1 tetratricopeptide repeat protein [candidate division KSB1 bacterium]MDZ7385871.1 tetratricopeptide repeat protein [candidate division KSB1 bacterium]MDZ7393649.1 tetratricopeptide repeat protein [candidate division KSB1 bacterium]
MSERQIACRVILLVALVLSLHCAAPRVSVPVTKPAQVDITGIKSIAIVDFIGPENSGAIAGSMLTARLFESKFFHIVEREKVVQILEEHKLAMAGIVDASTAKEAGRLLGVDALIFGEVTAYSLEPDQVGTEKVERKVGTGQYRTVRRGNKEVREEIMKTVLVDQEYRIRRGAVGVTFRMVKVETGELVAVKASTKTYDSGKVVAGRGTLKPREQILKDLLAEAVEEFARQVAPYVVVERRTVLGGKGMLDLGKKYAQKGLWQEARDAFVQAVAAEPRNSAAHYNLGLAHEVLGNLDQAEAEYQRAIKLEPKDLYVDALARVRAARGEAERLRKQIEH